jgi:protein-L-isoaspartate(D-aspartate) O-methyltransferase
MDFAKARYNMVEQQVRPWDVLDPRVLAVISEMPREQFTPDEYQNLAYVDTRIPLADGSTMLKPNIQGRILQHLDISDDDIVLEVGTGTGYLTACLARLARHVDSVDINAEACEAAAAKLQAMGIDNVTITAGDAAAGWDQQKPYYDAIAITGSLPAIPASYKQLLNIGGRMFVVTGDAPAMTAHLVTRTGKNSWTDKTLFETILDRLTGTESAATFQF